MEIQDARFPGGFGGQAAAPIGSRLPRVPGGAEGGVEGTRRLLVRTYGCQMNVHDSEKLANLLQHQGYEPAGELDEADLLVINTCSIREKAEHQLYSDLGRLREWKEQRPGRLLAVGGCVAQQAGDALLRRFPQLDFVFGTHNLRLVPLLVDSAERGVRECRTGVVEGPERFDLPARHPEFRSATPGRAFVTVMEGCDLFCTYCIVPLTRGREISRPAEAIVAEVRALVDAGVVEVTLLGQTVNAYGRQPRKRRGEGVVPFAELLARLDAIQGLRRIRYTSPHPAFFDAELLRAHRELASLCPHVHLPLQSGSDAVLARMRRRYTREDYLRVVEGLRAGRPDLALTTDLIAGFPGESDSEFAATLDLVREVGFVDSYAFRYSPRPGTAAAGYADPLPVAVAQERLVALQDLQRELTLAAHRARVGGLAEVLVDGASRRGGRQLSGRDAWHRVVNFEQDPARPAKPGELRWLRLLEATPHSLVGELIAAGEPAPERGLKPAAPVSDETGKARDGSTGTPGRAASGRGGRAWPRRAS